MIKLEQQLPVSKLIDLSLSVGMAPNAKFHYGWHKYSKWQLESMTNIGLKSDHKLLDIGCGPLRFGLEAINYLDNGNYFGIDPYAPYISLGMLLLKESGLTKDYRVIENDRLEFKLFNTTFDFAIAQSVFTHMSREQVISAFENLKPVMNSGGVLLFTNIEVKNAKGFLYGGRYPMTQGVEMTRGFYQEICDSLGLEIIPHDLEHPAQQVYLVRF